MTFLCSSLGAVDREYCHAFDFMLGMLWYNIPFVEDDETTAQLSILALLDLAFRHSDYELLNQLSYNSSYATVAYGEYTDPAWRERAFKFCDTPLYPNISCSVLLFNAYDEISTIATDYYYPLDRGACNNSFTISDWYQPYLIFFHSPPPHPPFPLPSLGKIWSVSPQRI